MFASTVRAHIGLVILAIFLLSRQVGAQSPGGDPWEKFAKAGDFASAEAAIERGFKAPEQKYESLWRYLFYLQNETERLDVLLETTDRWLNALRRDRPAALGRILKERGMAQLKIDYKAQKEVKSLVRARNTLVEAILVNPDIAEAYLYLALIYAREGQAARALQWLELAQATARGDFTELVEQMMKLALKDHEYLAGALDRFIK